MPVFGCRKEESKGSEILNHSIELHFFGTRVRVRTSHESLAELVRNGWRAFSVKTKRPNPHIEIDLDCKGLDREMNVSLSYQDPNFYFMTGKNLFISCYTGQKPWKVHVLSSPSKNVEDVYHYGFERILHSTLNQLNMVRMHASAVAIGGKAVLFCGPSGSGKTTTALTLVKGGGKYISDETVILHSNGHETRVRGKDNGFSVRPPTFGLLPQVKDRGVPRGKFGKRHILRHNLSQKDWSVAAMIFPKVGDRRQTKLTRMEPEDVYLEFLAQDPRDVGGLLKSKASIHGILESYRAFAEQIPCFRASLGRDTDFTKKTLMELV